MSRIPGRTMLSNVLDMIFCGRQSVPNRDQGGYRRPMPGIGAARAILRGSLHRLRAALGVFAAICDPHHWRPPGQLSGQAVGILVASDGT